MIQALTKLKENLPGFEVNLLGVVGEGISLCSVALLQAMKTALNSNSQINDFVSKAQRTLLSLSNTEYLLQKVFYQISFNLQTLFSPESPSQVQDALSVKII